MSYAGLVLQSLIVGGTSVLTSPLLNVPHLHPSRTNITSTSKVINTEKRHLSIHYPLTN